MMENPLPQKNLFSYCVDLDQRVRSKNPLRKVVQMVGFSFVREEVKERYGYNGNEGLDPQILLKLMFLLFWDDIRSERELMQILPERLDYLWFLGYSLDDEIPNHSVLSKARIRRRYLMEGSFAHGLNQHHFKRSRWRHLGNQCIQDHLICAIQNARILITRSLPPKMTAEALIELKYKIQNLDTPLKYLYKALIRNVRALYGDNDCLSTSSINTHATLPHPFLSPFGQKPLHS
jgi:hypothetical protein